MNNVPEQPIESNIVSPPPVSGKRSGALAKIIIIIIILGIIGAGTALATRVWDPVWSPFRPSPEKVMASMSEKMLAIKSSHSDMKINIDIKGENPLKAAISFSGDSDNNDLNNPKAEGIFGISFTGQLFDGSAETVSAKLKIKVLSQTEGYFNIEELNVPSLVPILMMMGIDLDNIVENWIKIPIENQLAQNNNAQTAALTEQFKKILFESKVYNVKEQLSDQVINGQKMYHYLVVLDNDKTAKLIGDLMGVIIKQSTQNLTGQEDSGLLDVNPIKGSALEFLNKIGEISAELSIGKKDNLLYGFKMEKNIDLSKINYNVQGSVLGDDNIQGSVDIIFETNNSKFNQPVKVEAPASFKNYDEVFPPLSSTPFPVLK